MEILSRDFGKIEIKKENILYFKEGLPGFEDYREFVLLPYSEDSPFIIMQSLKEADIAFITVEPGNLIDNYEFEISDKAEKELKINDIEDILVLNIITLKDKMEEITVNLSAPLVINMYKKLGKQIILNNQKYKVKYPLFASEELEVTE